MLNTKQKTWNRRELLGAAGVAAAGSALLPLTALADGNVIRIGYINPQTGPLAVFGETDSYIIGQVKEAVKNGLTVGGKKYAVDIIVKDSQSNPNRAAELAGELINKNKIHLMLASSTPDTTNPVADQCELAEIPCISTAAPWEAWYFGRGANPGKGFDWTYHFFLGLSGSIQSYGTMWESVATNKTVGFLFPNDADGDAWANKDFGMPPGLKKMGYKLVDPGRYNNNTDNFTAHITAFKKAGVEIITGVMNPPDWTTFWNQARQQGFKPKVATIAKAISFPGGLDNLGDTGVGLSAEVPWMRSLPYKSSLNGKTCEELASGWEASAKKPSTPSLGWTSALFEVAIDVLKRSSDPTNAKAVRDAIKKTKLNTMMGTVDFAGGPMRGNVSVIPTVVAQYKKGTNFKYEPTLVFNSAANGKVSPLKPLP